MTVHAVFACHLCAFRKVIDLLVSSQSLICLTFDIRTGPCHWPFLISIRHFAEAVIFERVAYQCYVYSIIELKVEASVLRFVRSQCHRVYERPEHEVFLGRDVVNSFVSLKSLLKSEIKLAWLMLYNHLVDLVFKVFFNCNSLDFLSLVFLLLIDLFYLILH